jgi:hypothetical protein
MMLIDTRIPPPDPGGGAGAGEHERAAWEPNWRLWAWVALTIAALAVADASSGFAAYVLACAGLAFACRAIAVVTPSLDGLRDYRQ